MKRVRNDAPRHPSSQAPCRQLQRAAARRARWPWLPESRAGRADPPRPAQACWDSLPHHIKLHLLDFVDDREKFKLRTLGPEFYESFLRKSERERDLLLLLRSAKHGRRFPRIRSIHIDLNQGVINFAARVPSFALTENLPYLTQRSFPNLRRILIDDPSECLQTTFFRPHRGVTTLKFGDCTGVWEDAGFFDLFPALTNLEIGLGDPCRGPFSIDTLGAFAAGHAALEHVALKVCTPMETQHSNGFLPAHKDKWRVFSASRFPRLRSLRVQVQGDPDEIFEDGLLKAFEEIRKAFVGREVDLVLERVASYFLPHSSDIPELSSDDEL